MSYDVPHGTKRKRDPPINGKLRYKIFMLKERINELEEKVEELMKTEAKRVRLGVTQLEKTVASIVDPLGPLQTLAERLDALEEWRDLTEQAAP